MYKIILITLVTLFIVNIGISFYFYNIAVARSKKQFLENNEDLQTVSPTPKLNDSKAWFEEQKLENVEIKSEDGLKLKGYYLEAKKPSKKVAILVHGYASRGKSMAAFAKFYHNNLDYNVLIPDNRGHGERLPSNVKAIISDCAYTSVRDQLSYQLSRMYKLPSFPILQSTSLLTKIKAGYFFGEASAIKRVKRATIPILFIHGKLDKFVPYEMLDRLYRSCNSKKDIFTVPDAGHANAYTFDKEGYELKVTKFLNKYTSQ